MGADLERASARRSDMRKGLTILFASFLGCMGLSLVAMYVSTPKPAPPPAPPSKENLVGFPNSIQPFALVQRARSVSVRSEFRGFAIDNPREDGIVDLNRPGASLRFVFQSAEGAGPQPPRKGGTLPAREYCGTQSVVVDQSGIFAQKDQPKTHCPRKAPHSLREPKECTLSQVIQFAKQRRIPIGEGTQIEFFESERGPAYRYSARGTQKFVISAKDCKTALLGKEQRGGLP